jgi:hydroxymethylpyrimidine kinase/phosphomethylpyrimidine kinase
VKRILTIAGSDSGGGAGIQADIRTISVLGGFGMSVITALTAQNTCDVRGIIPVPPEFVRSQLDAVVSDIGVDAVKTGMLANAQIVEVVAEELERLAIHPLVSDPVILSKGGHPLLTEDAYTVFVERLLPLVDLLTPNLPEARFLSGIPVRKEDQWKSAAEALHKAGAKAVLIKGGHGKGKEARDLLFDGKDFYAYSAPRMTTPNTHGTGCVFSAALATFLAQGMELPRAVSCAKEFITEAIRFSLPLGHGHGPTNPYASAFRDADRYRVLKALEEAALLIGRHPEFLSLAPEVQSNLGYALPRAETIEEVAAFPGRFSRLSEGLTTVHPPTFGASQHIARIILTAMRTAPELRSAMNIRYAQSILDSARKAGLAIALFNRGKEPREVKAKEGATLEWGIQHAMDTAIKLPDLIYDVGDVGKEPMIRILGQDPQDVVRKAFLLI